MQNFLKLFCQSQETHITSDPLMNLATSDIKSVLIEKYKHSEYARKTALKIREMSNFVSNPRLNISYIYM